MTQRTRLSLLALLLLACAAAAFAAFRLRAAPLTPVTTASGRTLTGLCGAAARAECDKRVECGQMDRAQAAACLDQIGAECERTLGWKLRAGVLTSGGEAQDECLESLADASCNALQFMLADDEPNLFELTSRCELAEMLTPHSGLGAACAETTDCTVGYCPGLSPTCHRCRPFVAEGEPCAAGVLECDPASARCAQAEGSGARCARLSADGAACTVKQECRSGACRQAASGGARVCAPAPAGTPCADLADCAKGFSCRVEGDHAGGHGACAPASKNGEPCAGEAGACLEQEASCVAGRCQVRPYAVKEGEACVQFSDCRPGLHCQGAKGGAAVGHCAPQAPIGGGCEALDFGGCGADATCAGGHCRRLHSTGERCAAPYSCKAFLSCVPASPERGYAGGATCAANPIIGEACNRFLPCAAGSCDGASGKCVPLAAGGQACATAEQCESHWCVGPPGSGVCYAPCKDPAPPKGQPGAAGPGPEGWSRIVAALQQVAEEYPEALEQPEGKEARLQQLAGLLAEVAALLPAQEGAIRDELGAIQAGVLGIDYHLGSTCERLAARIIERAGLTRAPAHKPDLANGKAIYAQACAACHGGERAGPSPIAATMTPAPVDLWHPQYNWTPYGMFNRVTFGGVETAMPSFAEGLSAEERWDVVFYLFAERWPPCKEARPPIGADELAVSGDFELSNKFGYGAAACLRRAFNAPGH